MAKDNTKYFHNFWAYHDKCMYKTDYDRLGFKERQKKEILNLDFKKAYKRVIIEINDRHELKLDTSLNFIVSVLLDNLNNDLNRVKEFLLSNYGGYYKGEVNIAMQFAQERVKYEEGQKQ